MTLKEIQSKLDYIADMIRFNIELQEILLRELGSQKGLIVSLNDNWEITMCNPTDEPIVFFEEIIPQHDTLRVKTRLSA